MVREDSRKHLRERHIDNSVADSFPASDPPSHSGITGVGAPRAREGNAGEEDRPPSHQRGKHGRPTGHPTWERHATETAHSWEDEDHTRK
jgi:hypothetical protein